MISVSKRMRVARDELPWYQHELNAMMRYAEYMPKQKGFASIKAAFHHSEMGYHTQAKLSIIMNLQHAQQWRGMQYALCTGLDPAYATDTNMAKFERRGCVGVDG
jgi:hypothetical protein